MKKLIFFIGIMITSLVGLSQVESNQQIEKRIIETINGIRNNPKSFINNLKEYNKDSTYSLSCDKSVKSLVKKLKQKNQISVLVECDSPINLTCISEFTIDNSSDNVIELVVSLFILNDDFIKIILNDKYKFISVIANDDYIIIDFGY